MLDSRPTYSRISGAGWLRAELASPRTALLHTAWIHVLQALQELVRHGDRIAAVVHLTDVVPLGCRLAVAVVAVAAGAHHVARAALRDGRARRARVEQKELPVARLGIEARRALDHRFHRDDLDH